MRKIHVILILSLLTLSTAPAKDFFEKNLSEKEFIYIEENVPHNYKIAEEKISFRKGNSPGSSTQEVFLPDSLYVYSGEGKLLKKKIFRYDLPAGEYTQELYEWFGEPGKPVHMYTIKEVYDEKGNEILLEEHVFSNTNDSSSYCYGTKYVSEYNEKDEYVYWCLYKWDKKKNDWQISLENKRDSLPGIYTSEWISYDTTGVADDRSKFTTIYENGNIKSKQEKKWNFEEKKWVGYELRRDTTGDAWKKHYLPYIEYVYSFNAEGKVDSFYPQIVSTDPESPYTKRDKKYGYKYDGDHITGLYTSLWDPSDSIRDKEKNDWINESRYEYMYDEHKNLILNQSFGWDKRRGWIALSRNEYAYDGNNNLTSDSEYHGKDSQGDSITWKLFFRKIYQYDSKNRETLMEANLFNQSDNTPIGTGKEISEYLDYTYNEKDFYKYYEYQTWDYENKRWTPLGKTITETDTKGKPSGTTYYKWTDGQWKITGYVVFYPHNQANKRRK